MPDYLPKMNDGIPQLTECTTLVFYPVSALLFYHSIDAKTHKGVRIKFMSEFIKTGLFDKEYGKLFSDLFDWRQEGDYSDFVSFDKDLTLPLIDKSEKFISLIRNFLTTTKR